MCGRGALLGELDPVGMRPRPNKKTPRNRVLMGAVFVCPDCVKGKRNMRTSRIEWAVTPGAEGVRGLFYGRSVNVRPHEVG